MTINDVIHKYDGQNLKIQTRMLEPDEESEYPYLLIEGTAEALRKLAELIMAIPEDDIGTKLSMSPNGAGSAHFTKNSTIGLYINCIE